MHPEAILALVDILERMAGHIETAIDLSQQAEIPHEDLDEELTEIHTQIGLLLEG